MNVQLQRHLINLKNNKILILYETYNFKEVDLTLKKKQEKIMLISLMNNYIFSLNYIPVNQYPKLFLPVSQQEHSEVLF